jgi:membrane-associated phospholipid phosphatase
MFLNDVEACGQNVLHDLNGYILGGTAAGCGIMMGLERYGLNTTLKLPFKGDVKRESRFLAQYGQFVSTALAAILVVQLDSDPVRQKLVLPMVAGTVLAMLVSTSIKRLVGRVRPGRPQQGQFLGFTLRHDNQRESFPSNHSAAAVGLSTGLAIMYPQAAGTFWALALIVALLRYLMDAHWPSDILAGIAVGYGSAHLAWWFLLDHLRILSA